MIRNVILSGLLFASLAACGDDGTNNNTTPDGNTVTPDTPNGGSVVRVAEVDMDAVTALSGSGPAYFALLAEAMIEHEGQSLLVVDPSHFITLPVLKAA